MTDPDIADELVGTVRQWVDKEVIAVASDYEHRDEFPAPLVEQMAAFGLFGSKVPEEFGGLALDTVTYARLMEELSYGWMSLAGVLNTHTILVTLLVRHGTEDQQRRFLPDLATGKRRGAFSLSEPDAGSDAAAISCKATPDGDAYVIDGTKMWVTNGERAGLVALAARTPEGISCFLVEKHPGPAHEGISVSRSIEKLGYKGLETVEMTYSGHRVPASAVLGGPEGLGRGLPYVLGALELGRVNIAARAVGVARAAFDAAMRYVHERQTFGVPTHAVGGRQAADAERCRALRCRRASRRRSGHGQAVCLGDRPGTEHRGDADPRWLRVHHGVPRRAVLPGRTPDDHRRGHQRDPAAGDCARSPAALVEYRRATISPPLGRNVVRT
jgi:alkylation response protein AidB-like acyl-CoA dehydrogenase